jgi:acyl carrier protein
MGLDAVELAMAFEEKFTITIPDEEAERMVTPRHVIDYIYSQVQHSDTKTCLSQRSFYRLRRALQHEFGLERRAVRANTSLDSIVPRDNRRSAWARLKQAADVEQWPELSRSGTTVLAIAAASVAVATAVLVADPPFAFGAAVFAAIGSSVLLARATQTLRLHFNTPATVGQLAEFLVARDPERIKPLDQNGWSREQVRQVVRAIIIDHLNVEPTFSDDASFIDDLGMA